MKDRYIVEIILQNPKDKTKKVEMFLTFYFKDYGNGYHAFIETNFDSRSVIDLRYNKSFDPINKVPWIVKWLYDTWTGKNGSWSINEFTIK